MMRNRSIVVLSFAVVSAIIAPKPAAAEIVIAGGGKNAQILVENLTYTSGFAMTTITFPKGKPKHLLVVQVTATSTGPGFCNFMAIGLSVNDHSLYDNTVSGTPTTFGPGASALGVGDIDQLEADSPGTYVGKPLEIDLGFNPAFGDTCSGVTFTAVAQLIKK